MSFIEHWLQGPQSTNFYTRTYTPSEDAPQATAVVIYIHGFAEHIGRYAHFHPKLAERGVIVFTFDQRGFGKTVFDEDGHKSPDSAYGKTSWTDQIADIAWAIDHVKEKYPALPLFLVGHSMVMRRSLRLHPAATILELTYRAGVRSWVSRHNQRLLLITPKCFYSLESLQRVL